MTSHQADIQNGSCVDVFRRAKNRAIGSGVPLESAMEIMWGLTIWTVPNTARTGLIWLHGIHLEATAVARDPGSAADNPQLRDSFDSTQYVLEPHTFTPDGTES